jgi:DNA repair exonuclease SbcCD ATPase subunit
MLTFKRLEWGNCFSYGEDNHIVLDNAPLTQLMGVNGSGKTSISLMIQEILYGKNIKNIKKQDITNNKSGIKGYWINLYFAKDGDEYKVQLDRKSSLKFRLLKNDNDISSHTSLNTYKTLADIIGVADFKIFCQLIYQHSTDSLDFLTATDTNRKKFLISLLQLDRYIELHELFKDKVKHINIDITSITGSVETLEAWILKHKDMNLVKQDLLPVQTIPSSWYTELETVKQNIANINSINRKIVLNQQYRIDMDNLDAKYFMGIVPAAPNPSSTELRAQVRVIEHQYRNHQNKINKLNGVEGQCPACLQEVDVKRLELMIKEEIEARDHEKARMDVLWNKIPAAEEVEAEIAKYKKEKADFERLSQLIDPTIPFDTLDLAEEKEKLKKWTNQIQVSESAIKSTEKKNLEISAHNSKVDVVKNQLVEIKDELLTKNIKLTELENLSSVLELLKKTFGTNGLVSYKIESSVKELERKINEYLAELTHFQIYFKLNGERLNIEVMDDVGNITSISNLSSGERARVNIATILSIRSILSSLTSTKINLLFLDEVIGVIDAEGKEKLSEVLLEENLNTFIVSHDWSHPLIPKINIIKEKHISRIEND